MEQENIFLDIKRDPNKIAVDMCINEICKNFGLPGVVIREVRSDVIRQDIYTVFVEIMSACTVDFTEREIHISNPKEYRRIRNLVRLRLINAFNELKTLAEESLRNIRAGE